MNRDLKIVLITLGAVILLAVLILGGFFLLGRNRCCGNGAWGWGGGMHSGGNTWQRMPFQGGGWNNSRGPFGSGMRGGGWFRGSNSEDFGFDFGGDAAPLSIETAAEAVEDYLEPFDGQELIIGEVMIFDNHAYVQVLEEDTGIGAMELIVDPADLSVYPEMGPNMMWNEKYGRMGGGMMGGFGAGSEAEMPISEGEAVQIAADYLSGGESPLMADEHAVPFYGYYTLHTLLDGEIYGMLSVNGTSGEVLIHSWHGDFIEMSEHVDSH